MLTKTKTFFSEVRLELQKASWPWDPKEKGMKRYKELTDSTLVVIIAMLLLGGYVVGGIVGVIVLVELMRWLW